MGFIIRIQQVVKMSCWISVEIELIFIIEGQLPSFNSKNKLKEAKMKKSFIIACLSISICLVASGSLWAFNPQPEPPGFAKKITELATRVHTDFHNRVMVQKALIPDALAQQKELLLNEPDVKEVMQLRGNNLFVKFKDGNELLMFLGKDNFGGEELGISSPPAQILDKASPQLYEAVQPAEAILVSGALASLLPCTPNSNKALVFDCLEDDANVVSPKIAQQIRSDLISMGYSVTMQLNNGAGLANAALIDNGEYGVVVMRGHGGDLGGDFGFLVRPWYTSYPPANSGYVGTIRASAYNHAAGATQFGYVITQQFSSNYWTNKAFPNSMFFLESCHGTDPGALPGMPTWVTNHGACVWLGWDESVSFNCGDHGTDLFFQKMKDGKNVGEALAAVHATGCEPPVLTSYPAGKEHCKLAVWCSDVNESAIPDTRDFKLLKLISTGTSLSAKITFYAVPNFNEFFFYADTVGTNAAEVLVRCHMNNFEVYKQTSPGMYTNKVYTGTPGKSGNDYSLAIPWNTAFGSVSAVKIWLYDMAGKDRLPNSGSVSIKK
ncbi:MAG: hypothetical protein AAB296_01515 [Candidatus Desantisbacteria bacterium]